MNRSRCLAAFVVALLVCVAPATAQTSYPMIMSLKPVAAQVGQTSEHTISSRYSMYGASQVLVTGGGVTGAIVPPEAQPDDQGNKPNLQAINVRFTVDADAEPGVRDFRIVTPQGASTLGQLVVVRDPVVAEADKNDTPDQAQPITVPATVCGVIEKAEDVDFYRFQAEAGAALTFHVRSMRLQDKIHDLQQHVDPILTLRTAAGNTLAASDNYFFGDPFLAYRFDQAGEYLLEIRDVRYQGNAYWVYSIEIGDRPFVTTAHPLGVTRGQSTTVRPVGVHLPSDATAIVQPAADAGAGPSWFSLEIGGQTLNPVPQVVTDGMVTVETDAANDTPDTAPPVTVPGGISGRVESANDVDCYRFEAKKGERFTVEVHARRLQSELDSHLRIVDLQGKQLAMNDDLRIDKRSYADSRIENWIAPADGPYAIEIRDLHLRGGEGFVYYLHVTRAEPHFELFLDTDKTLLAPGTSGVLFARVERKNGFDGEILLDVEGLPERVTAHCGRILPGKGQDGCIILQAAADAPPSAANITVRGTAGIEIDGRKKTIHAAALPYQETYQPGGGRGHWPVEMHTVSVGEPSDIREVRLSTAEITLKPGQSQRIDVEIVRGEGFDKNVSLDVQFRHLSGLYGDPLPPGVTLDAKNSKTLLTAKETSGHITLKAADDAPEVASQQIAVMANVAINFVMKATYSSPPLRVTVAK